MKKTEWQKSVNAFKGIAAIIIAYFYHYKNEFGGEMPGVVFLDSLGVPSKWLEYLYTYGYLGVEFFFVMSGFIMYYSYYERIHDKKIIFKSYLSKRVIRIFPLFYATTIVALVIQQYNYMKYGTYYIIQTNDLHRLMMNVLGLESMPGLVNGQSFNAPAWFLTVIFVCYILFYIISWYFSREKLLYASFLLTILGIYLVYDGNVVRSLMLSPELGRGYLSFFWGVILAVLFERLEKRGYPAKGIRSGIVAIFLFFIWGEAFLMDLLGNILTTFTLCICTGIVILIKTSYVVSKLSGMRVLQVLGKASFSIYLWNFPTDMIFDLINKKYGCFNYARISFWLIHFWISLGLALLSYYWVEPRLNRRFQQWVEKYII